MRLATEMTLDKSFTGPPSRHVLAKMAELRNAMPLPPIKPHCGLRLPPDRYCLTGVNYKLRATNQPKKMTKSALEGRNVKTVVKPVSSANGPKRAHSIVSKQQVVTIPKPVIKFTTTTKTVPAMEVKSEPNTADMKMELDNDAAAVGSIAGSGVAVKREREEEDFEFTAK